MTVHKSPSPKWTERTWDDLPVGAKVALALAAVVALMIFAGRACGHTTTSSTTTSTSTPFTRTSDAPTPAWPAPMTPSAPATSPQPPPKLNGQQEYKSAQQIANDLTARGHRCDMSDDSPGDYVVGAGRCYLGGSTGPEVVLAVYASQSRIDDYFAFATPTMNTYAWLVGNKWTINCGTRVLCSELQADMGGSITASANQPPLTTTTPALPKPLDEEIADSATRYIIEGFGLGSPPAVSFKDIPCDEVPVELCWPPHVNNITYSAGILYLHMDTDFKQPPDQILMVKAQNAVASLLRLGPGPKIVMSNSRSVQSMDRYGVKTMGDVDI
jgi:hypothetical protein